MKVLLFIFALVSINISSHVNMRKCLLLPILNKGKEEMAFNIFRDVEVYLKNSRWCFYRPNSDILDILQNFKNNLQKGLKNKEVLRLVAEKTGSGSLIRIDMEHLVQGLRLRLDVVGPLGEDIYFRREADLQKQDVSESLQKIKEWLNSYSKEIPYDGMVTGVLGDQLTIDVGSTHGILQGDHILIKHLLNKKKHPLLGEIIGWETRPTAKGKIFHTTETVSQGKAFEYGTDRKIQIGDWVKIVPNEDTTIVSQSNFEKNDYEFGKLGFFQILFGVGTGSAKTNTNGEMTNTLEGIGTGADFKLELWATRHFFTSLKLGKNFGDFKKKQGPVKDNSLNETHLSFVVGHKYLPLGFFYGPQVNTYVGYAKNTYNFDTQQEDGLTGIHFKGFLFGVKGDLPLRQNIRGSIELGFIFRPNFEEDIPLYGEPHASSHTFITLGGDYVYRPNLHFHMSLGMATSEAQFSSSTREIEVQTTLFKLGTSYTF